MRRNASGGKVIDGIRAGLIGGDSGRHFSPRRARFRAGQKLDSGGPRQRPEGTLPPGLAYLVPVLTNRTG